MADTLAQSRSSPSSARAALPGSIKSGRLNYGLHENVVATEVLDKVREARRQVIDSRYNITKEPEFTASTWVSPQQKFNVTVSDQRLSNTLSPQHINSGDFRTLSHSTFQTKSSSPAEFTRAVESSGWNSSTVTDGPGARQAALQEQNSHSLRHTRGRSQQILGDKYVSPVQRADAVSDRVRQQKQLQGVDVHELTAQYGPEGAAAMQTILSMPKPQRAPGQKPPRIRTTADDLAAVAALPLDQLDDPDEPPHQYSTPVPPSEPDTSRPQQWQQAPAAAGAALAGEASAPTVPADVGAAAAAAPAAGAMESDS